MQIETSTTWKDSGYDCDHCGGRILKRTDHETGQPDQKCYQCESCGCQWTLSNHPLRVGTLPICRSAQGDREAEATSINKLEPATRWLLIALAGMLVLALTRFGGGAALRVLIPLAIVGGLVFLFSRLGKRQDWW